MNWQPIETAPKDGLVVFVTGWHYGRPETRKRWYAAARFHDGEWLQPDDDSYSFIPPTHWAAITEPPND